MRPFLLCVACSLAELPLAVGVGFIAFFLSWWLGCKATRCVDTSGALWMLVGLVAGIVLGVAYWLVAMRLKARWRERLTLDAIALAADAALLVFVR